MVRDLALTCVLVLTVAAHGCAGTPAEPSRPLGPSPSRPGSGSRRPSAAVSAAGGAGPTPTTSGASQAAPSSAPLSSDDALNPPSAGPGLIGCQGRPCDVQSEVCAILVSPLVKASTCCKRIRSPDPLRLWADTQWRQMRERNRPWPWPRIADGAFECGDLMWPVPDMGGYREKMAVREIRYCDDSEDCGPGERCCVDPTGPADNSFQCVAAPTPARFTCPGHEICRSDATCRSKGARCIARRCRRVDRPLPCGPRRVCSGETPICHYEPLPDEYVTLPNGWRRERLDRPLAEPGVCEPFSDPRPNESIECMNAADCLPTERCCMSWPRTYCQGSCQNVVVCRSSADCAGILVREHNGWGDKYLPSQCVPCPVPGVRCCALPTWWDWPP